MKKNGEKKRGWNESGLLCSQIPAFKQENMQEAEKPQRKTTNRQHRGTHGSASQTARSCHPHHGLPMVVAVPSVSPASRTLRFVLVLIRVLACVGSFWTSFAIFFDLLGP